MSQQNSSDEGNNSVGFDDTPELVSSPNADSTPVTTDEKQEDTSEDTQKNASTEDTTGDKKSTDALTDEGNITEGTSTNDSGFDSDLDEWAGKAGHDAPETDKERKLLQKLRNNQREFTKGQQAKKGSDSLQEEINKQVEGTKADDSAGNEELTQRLNRLERENKSEKVARAQETFYTTNNIDQATGDLMAETFRELVEEETGDDAKRQAVEYWSNPARLSKLKQLAEAKALDNGGKQEISDQAALEERKRIEKESEAGGVQPSAKAQVSNKKGDYLDELWKD